VPRPDLGVGDYTSRWISNFLEPEVGRDRTLTVRALPGKLTECSYLNRDYGWKACWGTRSIESQPEAPRFFAAI
jgi:hypothetical protein